MTDFDYQEPKRLLEADPDLVARIRARDAELGAGATTSSRVAAGLAMGSAFVALAAVASDASAQSGRAGLPSHVVDVLNFALTLERLEAEFYTRGVATRSLLTGPLLEAADQIRKHEVAHVRFLETTLGAHAAPRPTFDYTAGGTFGDVFSNARTFMALAQMFEDTGVRAYKGQAAHLMVQRTLLRQALRIHSVEARHAAQIRRLRAQSGWITGSSRGDLPAAADPIYEGEANRFHFVLAQPSSFKTDLSEAFDEPLTKGQVLAIVRPFIRGVIA
jgi:hypothetical protein